MGGGLIWVVLEFEVKIRMYERIRKNPMFLRGGILRGVNCWQPLFDVLKIALCVLIILKMQQKQRSWTEDEVQDYWTMMKRYI